MVALKVSGLVNSFASLPWRLPGMLPYLFSLILTGTASALLRGGRVPPSIWYLRNLSMCGMMNTVPTSFRLLLRDTLMPFTVDGVG